MNYKTILILTAIAWTLLSSASLLVLYTNAKTSRDKRTPRTTRRAVVAAVLFFAFFLGGLELMNDINGKYLESDDYIRTEALRRLKKEAEEPVRKEITRIEEAAGREARIQAAMDTLRNKR